MDERERQLARQFLQILAEQDAFAVVARVYQPQRLARAAVARRAQHAHDRRDADASGDENSTVRTLPGLPGKDPVGAFQPRAAAVLDVLDRAGEIAQSLDRALQDR